jgi:hypothetical protein
VARQGAVRRREDIEIAMEESMMEIIPQLEKRTPYVALLSNIATLLGTARHHHGLIEAFTAVANANPAEKADLLSASISVAMNTTAFGLMSAIPLLLLHAKLTSTTGQIVDSLEMASVKALNTISNFARRQFEELIMTRRHHKQGARGKHRTGCHHFLNLMVVLIPFLLISAVFSRVTIMELSVPTSAGGSARKPNFAIEVIVAKAGLEIANGSYRGGRDAEKRRSIRYGDAVQNAHAPEGRVPGEGGCDGADGTGHRVRLSDSGHGCGARRRGAGWKGAKRCEKVILFPEISIGDAP